MSMRAAPAALHTVKEYDSGTIAVFDHEKRKGYGLTGNSLSARCKRLEENMMLNYATMQNNSRGIEAVVQRRKENAEKAINEIKRGMKELTGGSGVERGHGVLGIAPLNFSTLRERTAALEENAGQNQDMITSNRSIIDRIQAARKEKEAKEAGSQAPSARTLEDTTQLRAESAGDKSMVDRASLIEENARQIGAQLQSQAYTPPNNGSLFGETDIQVEQREARQYLLFGMVPSRPGSATPKHAARPFSAPAGASRLLLQASERARPDSSTSAISAPGTRPTSAAAAPALQRPSSANPWRIPAPKPPSANSMRSRLKAMEENAQKNKKIMATNRDGLEVVKKRREAAAQAMTDILASLTTSKEKD